MIYRRIMRIVSAFALVLAISGVLKAETTDTPPAVTADGFVTTGPAIGKPPRLSRPSVGLVLSGGGAKGIAHIGMIQALEDNDIPIDYITGTSMGAIFDADHLRAPDKSHQPDSDELCFP